MRPSGGTDPQSQRGSFVPTRLFDGALCCVRVAGRDLSLLHARGALDVRERRTQLPFANQLR